MHRFMNESCLNCNKFSHCNNNDLICISKYKIKEQQCEELINEKAEIKKYLGISDKTIIQRLEELQEFKDKLKISEYNYKQAVDELEEFCKRVAGKEAYINVDYILSVIDKANEDINESQRNRKM